MSPQCPTGINEIEKLSSGEIVDKVGVTEEAVPALTLPLINSESLGQEFASEATKSRGELRQGDPLIEQMIECRPGR